MSKLIKTDSQVLNVILETEYLHEVMENELNAFMVAFNRPREPGE